MKKFDSLSKPCCDGCPHLVRTQTDNWPHYWCDYLTVQKTRYIGMSSVVPDWCPYGLNRLPNLDSMSVIARIKVIKLMVKHQDELLKTKTNLDAQVELLEAIKHWNTLKEIKEPQKKD
jgi:hypothetical protein